MFGFGMALHIPGKKWTSRLQHLLSKWAKLYITSPKSAKSTNFSSAFPNKALLFAVIICLGSIYLTAVRNA
jgi:hypothetical protein